MWKILKTHPQIILFGWLSCFFSGIGQTYLLAMFNPYWENQFGISRSELAYMYAVATFLAALATPYWGRLMDTFDLHKVSLLIACGLIIGLSILFFAFDPLGIFLGFLLLRGFGQVAISLSALSFVSKYFGKMRGKGCALISLGRPLGEALFPIMVTYFLIKENPQGAFFVFIVGICLLLIPYIVIMRHHISRKVALYEENSQLSDRVKGITRSSTHEKISFCLKDFRMYLLFLSGTANPFLLTGILFHQDLFIAFKEWTPMHWAQGFTVYAFMQILASFCSGYLVDHFTATKQFKFSMIPLLVALLSLWTLSGTWALYLTLGLFGFAVGFNGNIRGAYLAEIYGPQHLATLRSIGHTFTMISTSMAPILFTFFLNTLSHLQTVIGFLFIVSVSYQVLVLLVHYLYSREEVHDYSAQTLKDPIKR